jgi:HD-GYP domain-containing protein (c-di-GMP phosphodiesterase class II)
MSQVLLHQLESGAMPLLEEVMCDVRSHISEDSALAHVPDDELRVALYTLLLKVCDMARGGEKPCDPPPSTPRDLFLRHARDMMEWVDNQSVYTHGHTRRVARHIVQMAARLGLSDDEINDLEAAAWIHNIGLIAQSTQMADIERRLSGEELKRARNHTVVGAEMIRPFPFVGHLVPVVRYHHHSYDGANRLGEPRGEGLPLGARLIAVADAYAAMQEPRAYRTALSRRQALDELVKGAGTQFDPKLVPLAHELT